MNGKVCSDIRAFCVCINFFIC